MLNTYIIYNLILSLSLVFSFIYKNAKSKFIKFFSISFIFFILWIPAAIRYGIGTDYFSYISILETAKHGVINTEIGYYLINLVVVYFRLDAQYIFAISSFIIYFNLIRSLNKKYFIAAILISVCTFYLPSLSLMRQAISISFAGLAAAYIIKGENLKSFFILIIGSFFHSSVLILIPFYLLKNVVASKKILIIITLIGTIIFVDSNILTEIINSSFLIESKYGHYADSKFASAAEIGTGLGVFLKLLIPLLTILFFKNNDRGNYNIILYMCVGAILFNIASIRIYIFNRVADVFMFLPYITIPILLNSLKIKTNQVILFLGLFLLFIIYFERAIFSNASEKNGGLGINPYISVLDK